MCVKGIVHSHRRQFVHCCCCLTRLWIIWYTALSHIHLQTLLLQYTTKLTTSLCNFTKCEKTQNCINNKWNYKGRVETTIKIQALQHSLPVITATKLINWIELIRTRITYEHNSQDYKDCVALRFYDITRMFRCKNDWNALVKTAEETGTLKQRSGRTEGTTVWWEGCHLNHVFLNLQSCRVAWVFWRQFTTTVNTLWNNPVP